MRCVKRNFPDFDWSKIEEAHGRGDFDLPVEGKVLDVGVTEADIANANPCCEFEEEQGREAVNAATKVEEQTAANNDAEKQADRVVVVNDSEEEERTE